LDKIKNSEIDLGLIDNKTFEYLLDFIHEEFSNE